MEDILEIAYIALGGAVVGALISLLGTFWSARMTDARERAHRKEEVRSIARTLCAALSSLIVRSNHRKTFLNKLLSDEAPSGFKVDVVKALVGDVESFKSSLTSAQIGRLPLNLAIEFSSVLDFLDVLDRIFMLVLSADWSEVAQKEDRELLVSTINLILTKSEQLLPKIKKYAEDLE